MAICGGQENIGDFFAVGRDFGIHFTPTAGISRISAPKGLLAPVASIGSGSHCQPDTQDLIDIRRLKGADMVLLDKGQAQAVPTRQMRAFAHRHMRSGQA